MPKHLRAREPKLYERFENWAESNPKQYDELVMRAYTPGLSSNAEQIVERVYNLWKIERGVN